jgi:predicted dehydrogenase
MVEKEKDVIKNTGSPTRRSFLKTSAAAGAATLMTKSIPASSAESEPDVLRVGLIGCGGRGTGAAKNAIESSPNVELVAMGDAFQDHLDESLKNLREDEDAKDGIKVTDDTCFVGFDAYQKVIASDVDMVILATPPHFRPAHLRAAIEANKHVFAEKPVATDAPGIRSVIETAELAKEKKLSIVAGTQRRHQDHYLEAMKRIHDGAIGNVISMNVYWNGGTLWVFPKEEGWSEMEYQMRNWYYFTWICGDHIVEQHVHNLDVANWAKGEHPVKAVGMGGRQVRTGAEYGHIFDHHAVIFEYSDGTTCTSMCRQMKGCQNDVRETIYGTKGVCDADSSKASIRGKFKHDWADSPNPYVQEHVDLIRAIRTGWPINEGKQVAESTLTAIMGRMATYTGKEVTWEEAMNSQEKLGPDKYEWGDLPTPEVAIPGKTPLV